MTWQHEAEIEKLQQASEDAEAFALACDDLVKRIITTKDAPDEVCAAELLKWFRGRKAFDWLRRVADALMAAGQDAPVVRRQYAQGLIEGGAVHAALDTLKGITKDTKRKDPEHQEAQGLIRRASKDVFLRSLGGSKKRSQKWLDRSIKGYAAVYDRQPESIWHGINIAALVYRAKQAGLSVGDRDIDEIATSLIKVIGERRKQGTADEDPWNYATEAEAYVALGRIEDAIPGIRDYVEHPGVDAFAIGGTLRQLRHVWQLNADDSQGATRSIFEFMRSKLLELPGGSISLKPADIAAIQAAPPDFERTFGTDSFETLQWYMNGLDRAKCVGRVEDPNGRGIGTAFLVDGGAFDDRLAGRSVVITNAHVVSRDDATHQKLRSWARPPLFPEDATVVFYGVDPRKAAPRSEITLLWESSPWELDASLLALNGAVEGPTPLKPVTTLPHLGDGDDRARRVYVIGHPHGGDLSFSLHDSELLDYEMADGVATGPYVHYRTPTEPGSSGSPLFDNSWRLVGLHHAGSDKKKMLNGKEGTYEANEGIWIKRIQDAIQDASLS